MKKWNAICSLTVLVIGMVFMSGCTSPVSTGTAPVAPTPPQTVNETVPIPPAQTPAPAVFTANETGHKESTFKDNNRNTSLFVGNETTGGLFINIRAGGSVDGLKIFISREGTNVSPIEYSFLPDRTVVEGENKGYLQVKILPDGRSELIKLLPGNYTAYLPNWNGGEPEQQSFVIREEEITPIWFAGFAASSGGGCGC